MICVDLIDCSEHIIRAWIHSLTALNDIVYTEFPKDFVHPVADGNCDEPYRFSWFLFLFEFGSFSLLHSYFLGITDQFFLMLLAHVVDLHA